jgi:hypothetical protein
MKALLCASKEHGRKENIFINMCNNTVINTLHNFAHRPCAKNYRLVKIVQNFFVFIQLVIHVSVEGEFLSKNHIS